MNKLIICLLLILFAIEMKITYLNRSKSTANHLEEYVKHTPSMNQEPSITQMDDQKKEQITVLIHLNVIRASIVAKHFEAECRQDSRIVLGIADGDGSLYVNASRAFVQRIIEYVEKSDHRTYKYKGDS